MNFLLAFFAAILYNGGNAFWEILMNNGFKKTIRSCFVGYIVQAIINNFIPLLFITFQNTYSISLTQVTSLITINFILQLIVDMASVLFVDKIGYRASILIAHALAAIGLVFLTFMPEIAPSPFIGIIISVTVYAIGSGLIEVLVSPIVEACPTDNKETTMSMLHSAYCWGHVLVVLVSTIFFKLFGIENWKILALIWAVVPAVNGFTFIKVPINSVNEPGEKGLSIRELFKNKMFWTFMLIMLCAGASEISVSQWSSAFAERALGVDKTIGDLAGPMAFAVLMGLSRTFYGKFGEKINLDKFMIASSVLCVASYLCIGLINSPVVSLIACAVCGLSVGIMWPGAYSRAAGTIKGGGTALFAMLALAGDTGCTVGPTVVGKVADAVGGNLKIGILSAVGFPILLIIGMIVYKKLSSKKVK